MLPATIEELTGATAIETRLAPTPVPLRDTVCGLLLALSENDKVPARVFKALGEKVTEAVQLPPAVSKLGLIGQVVAVVKSARLLATLVILRDIVWLFVRTTVCGALDVPKAWLPKFRLPGRTLTATIPVPLRATVGLTPIAVLTVRTSVLVPATVGAKNTEMLQLV